MIMLPILILSVFGIADSLFLSLVHLFGANICGGASSSCNEILLSPYSRILGIPLATLGLGIYCALLFLSQRGRDSKKRKAAFSWIFNVSLFGTIVSGYLIFLQASVIKQWCPFCLGSAFIMSLIFFLSAGYQLAEKKLFLLRFPEWKGLFKKVFGLMLLPSLIFVVVEFVKDRIIIEDAPVVRIEKRAVRLEEIDKSLGVEMYNLKMKEYDMRKRWFESELLNLEAEKRGVSFGELLSDLDRKISVDDHEIQEYFSKHGKRFPKELTEGVKLRIGSIVKSEKIPIQRDAFLKKLQKKYKASFFLSEPNPFSLEPNPRFGLEKGNPDARVVIVEFLNFTCSQCMRTYRKLEELLKQYPEDIRIIFRHFPSMEGDNNAYFVHNAAACAQGQGKFWSYVENLSNAHGDFTEENLYKYAEEINLDISKFRTCLETEQYKRDVDEDIEEGEKLGIKGAPTLFINGRFFQRVPSDYQLKKIIDEAIEKK